MAHRTPTHSAYGQFAFHVQRLAWMTQRHMDHRLRSELGISHMQYMILSVVDVYPGELNQRAVADFLGTTSATVSRHVELSSNAGHLAVQVSATSRRENAVTLTAGGRDLLARADAIVEAEALQVLGSVPPDEFAVAARVLANVLPKPTADLSTE